ncbi:MAG TPA: deoxyguanosinetriphosphate triphosphohydrolase [Synergistetes bacterium]|nr:deoxyguanosinetriphosphate triphosphohydrolase [Synergistota bacterium]
MTTETPRSRWERIERTILVPFAAFSDSSEGRAKKEEPCSLRTIYQQDRDRIIHCKSFRRLKHKTQVLLLPEGDHYRTRLTHTLEVCQIARTISRALALNEDLTDAIALGHDLGHTPFGHMGERVLDRIACERGLEGFAHASQSLRVVDHLEKEGEGLNLSLEVRDGILKHSKGQVDVREGFSGGETTLTLEARVVRVSDSIAYINHDLDDAMRAGIVKPSDPPEDAIGILGKTHGERIGRMVEDTVKHSGSWGITMSPGLLDAVEKMRSFLYQNVYASERVLKEEPKVEHVLRTLFDHYEKTPGGTIVPDGVSPCRMALDHVSGMTDRYALFLFEKIAMPDPWPQIRR